MSARGLTKEMRPIVLPGFTLRETQVEIVGRPKWEEWLGAHDFAARAQKCSAFWLGDLMQYAEGRGDWKAKLDQLEGETGLSRKRLENIRSVSRSVLPANRRNDIDFELHAEVAALTPGEQDLWLERAATDGWSRNELRRHIKASKRPKILEGQARLLGQYRVIYADPPWLYGDKPPSGSGAIDHYPGMTIDALCKLPIEAHALPNAVLFCWVTAPMLYESPGPREVIEAWGFKPKTGMVWDKVLSAGGHYVASKHEHLIIATRGSCLPDVPTPSPDSVMTIRRDGEHSSKPEEFRKIITALYTTGPYLELFARKQSKGWDVFGNDARLWK